MYMELIIVMWTYIFIYSSYDFYSLWHCKRWSVHNVCHSCKDKDFVFFQGNLAKSWGCVDFSFYYFSLGSHLTQ